MARTSSPDGRVRRRAVDVHFGTEATFFTPTGALPGQPPFDEDIRQTIQVVKVGLNYKFDWGGPIASGPLLKGADARFCIFMSSRPKLAHSSGYRRSWPLPDKHEQTTPWP